jgi:type III pantothenate kinase
MLLAIDIGNSSIKFGIFDKDQLTTKFSIPSKRNYSTEEISGEILDRLPVSIDAAIACSVVPEAENAISEFINDSFNIEPRFIRSTDDFGLEINFSVETTGTDRLVNSFAVVKKYGVPCVVVSFGTATTVDVVNKDREYLGGVIAPGMTVIARALSLATSKLPNVEIHKPENVIGQTTETAIQSGVVYGQIAMMEGLLNRVVDELNDRPQIIATGGFAELLAPEIVGIDVVDADLTLQGLNLINGRR